MSTIDTPHGIPTRYRGVNFRSRLEAKYAPLFDLLGWEMDVRTDRSRRLDSRFCYGGRQNADPRGGEADLRI